MAWDAIKMKLQAQLSLGSTPPDLSAVQWQLPPWESTLLPMLALCQNSADIELGGYHYVWAKKT